MIGLLNENTASLKASNDSLAFPHYFQYIKGKSMEKYNSLYGKYKLKKEKLKKIEDNISEEEWIQNIANDLDTLPKGKKNVIFYIHGFFADTKQFAEESGFVLQTKIFNLADHKYGLAVSLQWEAAFDYPKSINLAPEKGLMFAKTIKKIQTMLGEDGRIAVICHSMGNRVFQGVIEGLEDKLMYVDKVLLMAPDVEADIFTSHFKPLIDSKIPTTVFYNNEDKTLQMAGIMKKYDRLGHVGIKYGDELPPTLQSVDVTTINDDETLPGKITKHRYFYTSPTVRAMMVKILSE